MSESIQNLRGRMGDRDISLPLVDGEFIVGRSDDCDLVLSTPSVSRKHAALHCSAGRVLVEDLGSHNGTRVNDKPIKVPTPLEPGDSVSFADITLHHGTPRPQRAEFTMMQSDNTGGLALSWEDIRKRRSTGSRKKAELFQTLAEAGDLLTTPRAPEDLFEPILDIVENAMGPERIFLLCTPEGSEAPEIQASRLAGGPDAQNVVLSSSVVSRVLKERTSFLLADAVGDIDLAAQQSIVSQGIRSAMAAPLFDNKDVIGILYADTTNAGIRYTRDELMAFTLLANVIAVALTHARYDEIEAERRRMETELSAARSIMDTIIPEKLPEIPGFELCAHTEPCFEVGGDLYDVTCLEDGRVGIVLVDVSGKGLGAALLVSSLVPLLRAMFESESDLVALMTNLNRQLWRTTDPTRYATLFIGVLDPASGRFEYVNGGHNPPVLRHADGTVEEVKSTGVPVALMEEGFWSSATLDLVAGDMLALYTDGVSETWNTADEDYTDERFVKLISEKGSGDLKRVREIALADIKAFRGAAPVADDVTLLLISKTG